MTFAETFLPEFDAEMGVTRRVLERVPDDRLSWKPHAKSFTTLELATHVATLPSWATTALESDEFDVAPPGGPAYVAPTPASQRETLAVFDDGVKRARATIAKCDDAHLAKPWMLKVAGKRIYSQPRAAVLRGFVLNHLIHHRGALTVYLRLLDVPVPRVYGPSADEKT